MNRPLNGVHLTGWGRYAPELVLTNAELERLVETSDDWIVTRTGIRERRIAGPDETAASMGSIAARRAIAVAGLDPAEIDLILLATVSGDHPFPATASLVKEAIGNVRAPAMDVAAACSGFIYACSLAQAQIVAGMTHHVLVIGSELLSRFVDYTDRGTCVLFGDGAGAVVLSASEEPGGTLGISLTTEPSGAYMIWVPSGGSASPARPDTLRQGGHYLRMEGRETYRFATRTMASTARAALEQAGLTTDQIDLFIPHQANIRIIEVVAKGLGVPMERVFVNVGRYGNTSAASVPIALAEAVDAGRVKVGDRLAMVAFGAGFTSGALALQWTADPARARLADGIGPADVTVRRPPGFEPPEPFPPALRPLLDGTEWAAPSSAPGSAPAAPGHRPTAHPGPEPEPTEVRA